MASEELDRNFSELHVTRDSDCNGKSKILENQAVDGDVQITYFTEDLHDVTLHFQIIRLAKQVISLLEDHVYIALICFHPDIVSLALVLYCDLVFCCHCLVQLVIVSQAFDLALFFVEPLHILFGPYLFLFIYFVTPIYQP